MKVLIPKEAGAGEQRVAATPETVEKMRSAGLEVHVEPEAGAAAGFLDAQYREAGAELGGLGWADADAVLAVACPGGEQVAELRPQSFLSALMAPHRNLEVVAAVAQKGADCLALELIPRITRAQSMDVLSSQASIAGYKAVLLAAERLDKYFPLLMTAAGTIKPARVVVMGAGVAGLQAIATAKRLGAVVEVSDIRPEVEEQVKSLGGRFIPLPMQGTGAGEGGYAKEMGEDFLRRQREIVSEHVAAADVVITTALIPGRPAPTLVTREMVERMRSGALIVDLAVIEGGNCVLSQADTEVEHAGVRVLAPSNLAAEMARDASTLFARNVWTLVKSLLNEDGALELDLEDEVVAAALLTHGGEVRHAPTAQKLSEASS